MNECSMMMRRPINVQKRTRATFDSLEAKFEQTIAEGVGVTWAQVRPKRYHATGQHNVSCGEGVRQGEDIVLNAVAVVVNRVLHFATITNMLLAKKGDPPALPGWQ